MKKSPFETFQRERDQRIIRQTVDVIKMLGEGKEILEIAQETGLSIEDIKDIAREMRQ